MRVTSERAELVELCEERLKQVVDLLKIVRNLRSSATGGGVPRPCRTQLGGPHQVTERAVELVPTAESVVGERARMPIARRANP